MNKERLLRLANEILPHVPAEKFDMRTWKCGTTACAAGWAASDKQFRREGLSITTRSSGAVVPTFKDEANTVRYGYAACCAFFGLQWREAEFLFSPTNYACGGGPEDTTPAEVSERIRMLVRGHRD